MPIYMKFRKRVLGMHNNSIFTVLRATVKKYPWLIVFMLLSIIGSIVLALIPPLVLERIVNLLVGKQEVGIYWALIYFLFIALAGITDAGKEGAITVFGQKVTHSLRTLMVGKLTKLPADYYTRNQPGIVTSRLVNDVDTIELLFTSGIIGIFADCCKVVSILIIIWVKSSGLGILMILVTPVIFFITRIIQKKMLKAQISHRVAIGKVNNRVPETIRTIRMIHTFQAEDYFEDKYNNDIEEGYRAQAKTNFYDSIYSPIIIVISALIVALMIILSGMGGQMQVWFGMSVGTAVANIAYVSKVFTPLESIGMEIQTIQSAYAGIKRIDEFMKEPEKKPQDQKLILSELLEPKGALIKLKHVDFAYRESQPILQDFNLEIKAGEFVTILGRTGSGKSTAFKLILGLYSADKGEVLVFDHHADEIPDGFKRQIFGYVEQSFRAIPGNLRQQITLDDPKISEQMVNDALEVVGLAETINNLPDGLDTIMTKSLLSQGQWQLLAIARAIVANPPILLLDEITANLDAGTEQLVLKALIKASEKRTVVSISHRLQAIGNSRVVHLATE